MYVGFDSDTLITSATDYLVAHHGSSVGCFVKWLGSDLLITSEAAITQPQSRGNDSWATARLSRTSVYFLRVDIVKLAALAPSLCGVLTESPTAGAQILGWAMALRIREALPIHSEAIDRHLGVVVSLLRLAPGSHQAPPYALRSDPVPESAGVGVTTFLPNLASSSVELCRARLTAFLDQFRVALASAASPGAGSLFASAWFAGAVRITGYPPTTTTPQRSTAAFVYQCEPLVPCSAPPPPWDLLYLDVCEEASVASPIHTGDVVFARGVIRRGVGDVPATLVCADIVNKAAGPRAAAADTTDCGAVDPALDDACLDALQADLEASWWAWNAIICGAGCHTGLTDPAESAALAQLSLVTGVAVLTAFAAAAVRRGEEARALIDAALYNRSPPPGNEVPPPSLHCAFFLPRPTAALLIRRLRALAPAVDAGDLFTIWADDLASGTNKCGGGSSTLPLSSRVTGGVLIPELLRVKPHDVEALLGERSLPVVAFSDSTPLGTLPAKASAWIRRASIVSMHTPVPADGYRQAQALRRFAPFSRHPAGGVVDFDGAFRTVSKCLLNSGGQASLPPLSRNAMMLLEAYFKHARGRLPDQVGPGEIQNLVLIARLHALVCAPFRALLSPGGIKRPATVLIDALIAVDLSEQTLVCKFGSGALPVSLLATCPAFDSTAISEAIHISFATSREPLDVLDAMWSLFRAAR